MKKSGVGLTIVLMLMLVALLLNVSGAAAADGYYQLSEVSQPAWDGTTASRLDPPTTDYDYAYGDDESVSYNLPWSLQFYGRSYSGITADTNGNVWFSASGAAYDINLATTGRGPVISAWNSDLSSSYYGGVYIEHKTNPERIVIEWDTETYTEESLYSPNNFAVVLYPDGTIRFDYKYFSTENGGDSGSGISRGDGSASTNLTSQFGSVHTLAGRSFQFTPQELYSVSVQKDGGGSGTITSVPQAINCGPVCSGNFPMGSAVLLTATPGFGSTFEGWSGACSGPDPCTITVDGAKMATATFAESYAPAVAIDSPSGAINSPTPALSYRVSTGTVVVKVDGFTVSKLSGDLLDPLLDGEHVVRIESTNASGHVGFAETSFTIDSTPPATTITPHTGSNNIPVRASVLVEFTEEIDPASVNTGTAILVSDGASVLGEIRLGDDGKSLIFKSLDKLAYAASYTFTLKAGVRDLLGNALNTDQTTIFSTQMVDPDVVGYWPMDGDWKDYSVGGNYGTGFGSSSFTTGRMGNELSGNFIIDNANFAGSGGFISTPGRYIPSAENNFTISFWAKPTATRESTTESTSGAAGTGTQRFAIAPVNLHSLGYPGASAGISVGTNGISVFEETSIPSGPFLFDYMPSLLVYDSPAQLTEWSHIAVVYNNKQPSLYLNGTLVRTGLASTQPAVYPAALFAFGNERATGSYSGQLEGITVQRRALSATEIDALYQAQAQPVPLFTFTSPGQTTKYRPGEDGNATVLVTSSTGLTTVYCSTTGAATGGAMVVNFGTPQQEVTRQLSFTVPSDAGPHAPIVVSCVATTPNGAVGAGEFQLLVADVVPPTVVATFPTNNSTDVSATAPLTILFSEPIDAASIVGRDTYKVQRESDGAWISSLYRLTTDGQAMQILPSPALDSSTTYTITFSRLKDTSGNTMTGDYVLRFTTLVATSLVIEDQGTSTSPYTLAAGRYGTVTLNNSHVTASGGVTVDSLAMNRSNLNIATTSTVPGDLSVASGNLTTTDGSQLTIDGTLNVAGNLSLASSTMSVTGVGQIAGDMNLDNSTLTLKAAVEATGTVSLQNNSILTHFAATKTDASARLALVAANMVIDSTSKIDVTGKGYLGGYPVDNPVEVVLMADAVGYTVGNSTSGGSGNSFGGSYGGYGGQGLGGYSVGSTYGDLTNPNNLGSGGGGYYYDLFTGLAHVYTKVKGGSGGGLIRLTLGNLQMDGAILADGASSDAAGGSGGGIYITSGSITGSGIVSAKGGSNNVDSQGAGGGGGRIALYYNSMSLAPSQLVATGGQSLANLSSVNGSAGTIYLKKSTNNGDLIISNGNIASQHATPLVAGNYGSVTFFNSSVNAVASTTQDISADSLSLTASTFTINGSLIVADSILLQSGSLLTHPAATATAAYKLDITAGTFVLNDTSKIDVSGKGLLGAYQTGNGNGGMTYSMGTQTPTATGGSTPGSGGSYGGMGAGSGTANQPYGNLQQPNEPGSGGAGAGSGYAGSNGAGVVKLTANVLNLSGASSGIFADGNGGNGRGGSGGAIWINAGTLVGSGTISAKGGSGSGGGGRIAVYYTTNNFPLSHITAVGGIDGTGSNPAYNGGVGTIYLKDNSKTKADLYIDNQGVASSTPLTIAGDDYGQVTCSGETLIISSDMTATDMTLDGCTVTLNGALNVANTLTLQGGSVLNHPAATATTKYKLDVTAGTITLNDTSRIDVTGRGFLGGTTGTTYDPATQGPTSSGGSSAEVGGSYGGKGGNGSSNATYGSLQQPNEPGSGAGSTGANGGGVVKLTANAINLNGTGTKIVADGLAPDTTTAGGSGGAIWITTGTLSGTGVISAKGAAAGNFGRGGGGGGRIAINYSAMNLPVANISAAGGKTGDGHLSDYNGGAGTIYLKASAKANGDLTVSNGGVSNTYDTPVPSGDYGQVTVSGGRASLSGAVSASDVTQDAGSLTLTTGALTVANSVTLSHGSLLTHAAATSSTIYRLNLTADSITLNDTSKIDVSGKGLLGGRGWSYGKASTYDPVYQRPTTAGGSDAYTGGSYGGNGGGPGPASTPYGSVQQPNEPGSGGGGDGPYNDGSRGAGVVKITASSITLNGIGTGILADGAPSNFGSGSGGAVWINAGTITGTGTISAKGGAGVLGGGGGGRIAIYYNSKSIEAANISVAGGIYGANYPNINGGAGTLYLKDNAKAKGDVTVNNDGAATNALTSIPGGDYGQITLSGGAKIQVSSDISFAQDATFTGCDLTFNGALTASGNLTFDGSRVTVNGAVNVANTLNLQNGSVLSHSSATATTSYKLDIAAGTLNIDDTSRIDVSGKGLLGAYQAGNGNGGMTYNMGTQTPTATGGSTPGSGGSYGGMGAGSGTANQPYGNLQQPNEPGSGGAGAGSGYAGSNGAGVVKLTANVLNLSGASSGIFADGNGGNGRGGSGGAIWINVGTLVGSGTISAKGGSGSGGGGRIAVYYTTNNFPLSNITAVGGIDGTGSNPAYNGGAGTIYLKDNAKAKGDVFMDNGGVASSTPVTVVGGDYGQLTFKGTTFTISSDMTATDMTLDGCTVTLNGALNVANTLTLQGGSVLNHPAATATTKYKLDVTAGTITLNDTSRIDVTGRGFLGGTTGTTYDPATQGPTFSGGSSAEVGGSYGGKGGNGSSNATYGSLQQPNEPGSGAGSTGANGGGVVKLTANAINLNGTGTKIVADGLAPDTTTAGGSGGAIWITTGTLSGTGVISAKGAAAGNFGRGGGGGGRIAIDYSAMNLPVANISAAGGKTSDGHLSDYNGGAGTIYLKDSAKANGDLTVSNGGVSNTHDTPVPSGDYGQVTVSGGRASLSGAVSASDVTQDAGSLTLTTGALTVANSVTLSHGSVLTHAAATSSTIYRLNLTADSITLNDTSKIDVSGKGLLGGIGWYYGKAFTYDTVNQRPTTAWGSDENSGGSYGGRGGGGAACVIYGNAQQPNEPGSGGGGNTGVVVAGSRGAGVVKIIANSIDLKDLGTGIFADGVPTQFGGGSGGAVWINAGTIAGQGTISAKGGGSSNGFGGGGGGRIALYYNTDGLIDARISAAGGISGSGSNLSQNGGAGMVYRYQYQMPLTVTMAGTGTGTVSSSPAGITCGTTCSGNFGKNSCVTLTATASTNATFSGWSGACAGTGSCVVTMDAAKAVTATFAVIPTVIIPSPVGLTNNNRPQLQYSVSAGTVVVKVDGVVVNKVSGNALDVLTDGQHTVRVEANNLGITGYAESVVTVDTIATVDVNALPAIVKAAHQTLSGTVEVGGTVSIAVAAGTASLGSVSYPTSTTWQCEASNLTLGTNTFTITAYDPAGNSTAKSVSVRYALPPTLGLSAPSIDAKFQGTVALNIGNLDPVGSNALVEQVVDANRNGIIDASDYPIRSFTVTDGIVDTNPNLQGDEDGISDGTVTTTLKFALPSDIYHAPGNYLFRITNGPGSSTVPFTVTPVTQLQTVAGPVTDGANLVAGAMVRLLDKWQRPVAWTIANDAGQFILDIVEPGEYLIVPTAYGFVADPAGTPLTITADQNLTGHNLVMTAGALSLSGTVRKDQATDPVAGVWVQALGATGIGYAITGTDGSYDLRLPIGDYDVAVVADATMPNPAASGYLANSAQPLHVNLQLDTTGIDIALVPADLAVSGTVVDQNGNPLGGMPIFGKLAATADAREPAAFATTDASGNYLLSLVAGNDWTIALDDVVAQPLGYLGNAVRNFSTAGTLTDINFAVRPVTAFIKGTVRDSSANPLGNADVKLRNADSTIVMQLRTAADGTYRFGTYGGDWYLNVYPGQVGEQTATVTDGQTATIDLVVDSVPPEVTITSPTATTPDSTPQLIYNVSEGTVVVKVDNVVVNKVSGDSLDQLTNGEHTVVIESIDAAGNLNFASVTFNVNYAPLEIETNTVADGTVGTAFSQLLVAKGGVSPYDWTLSNGSIPTGLTLDRGTGVISGTPVVAETSTFTVRVTDSDGSEATQQYTLLLAPN